MLTCKLFLYIIGFTTIWQQAAVVWCLVNGRHLFQEVVCCLTTDANIPGFKHAGEGEPATETTQHLASVTRIRKCNTQHHAHARRFKSADERPASKYCN